MKRALLIVLAASLVAGPVGIADAGKEKPVKVWEDTEGDADLQRGIPVILNEAGFDLVSGSIVRKGKNLEFTATHSAMPPSGSLPEGFRFMWAFSVGKDVFRLTIKSADIGKPDVTQGQTTDRVGRVDLMGHFRLEGNCGSVPFVAVSAINCKPLGMLDGSFDPATTSLTAIVPMKSIKANPGSIIGPGSGDATDLCDAQVCWIGHIAERSPDLTLIDAAVQSKSYTVP